MLSYKNLTTAYIVTASIMLARMVSPQSVLASTWSPWMIPTQFEGNSNDYGSWVDSINVATLNDTAWMRNTTSFGNPAPEKWCKGFGFYMPEYVGVEISEIEARIRYRRLYNTNPKTNFEIYVVKDNQGLANALNAPVTLYTDLIDFQAFRTETFYWRDNTTQFWVAEYFPFYYPDSLNLVMCVQLASSTGSSNFFDVSQVELRILTDATDATNQIPTKPTQLQLSIENLQDTIKVRAPFAYFYAVTDIDFGEVTQEALILDFPVPYPNGVVHYYATIPQSVQDSLAFIRTLTGVAIVGSIVIYLISLGNRII